MSVPPVDLLVMMRALRPDLYARPGLKSAVKFALWLWWKAVRMKFVRWFG